MEEPRDIGIPGKLINFKITGKFPNIRRGRNWKFKVEWSNFLWHICEKTGDQNYYYKALNFFNQNQKISSKSRLKIFKIEELCKPRYCGPN